MTTTVHANKDMGETIQDVIKAVEAAHADGTNMIYLVLPTQNGTVTVPLGVEVGPVFAPRGAGALRSVHDSGEKLGLIVANASRTLYGTFSNNSSEVLNNIGAFRIKKPGMTLCWQVVGREGYVDTIAKSATKYYINPETGQPNIVGLVLSGTADLAAEVSRSQLWDSHLKDLVLKVVKLSPEGASGLDQAMHEIISNIDG